MRLWLDDMRNPPDKDWVWVKNSLDAIKLLRKEHFEIISLDHDLGDGEGTGYEVLQYIESEVYRNPKYLVPDIRIHTANTVARQRMYQAVASIQRQDQINGRLYRDSDDSKS